MVSESRREPKSQHFQLPFLDFFFLFLPGRHIQALWVTSFGGCPASPTNTTNPPLDVCRKTHLYYIIYIIHVALATGCPASPTNITPPPLCVCRKTHLYYTFEIIPEALITGCPASPTHTTHSTGCMQENAFILYILNNICGTRHWVPRIPH
jgi:hypothetical protein